MLYMMLCDCVLLCYLMTSHILAIGLCPIDLSVYGLQPAGTKSVRTLLMLSL